MLYFLYPYFWGSDDLAHERLYLDHPDPGQRDFLRSGFARVVVPIRPGFEEAFVKLTLTGAPGADPTPYLTIAEEIRAYAQTNYSPSHLPTPRNMHACSSTPCREPPGTPCKPSS